MSTSRGGPVPAGPYYVYVLNTGVVGCHRTPEIRLTQLQRKHGNHLKLVWVSKPFPARWDAEQYRARLVDKRDYEPPVFLRICRCEYDQTGKPPVLIPRQATETPYTLDLTTGAWSRNGLLSAEGRAPA